MSERDLWFVLSMDDGVRGVWRTKREAIEEHTPGRDDAVVAVHKYGPGAYDVKWHYKGDEYDGGDFFLEHGASIDAGGWEWALEAWRAAGNPMGHIEALVLEGAD